ILHHSRRSDRRVAHEIDRELGVVGAEPDVGERDQRIPDANQRYRKTLEISFIEAPKRESLFLRSLGGEPFVGDFLQPRKKVVRFLRRNHLETRAGFHRVLTRSTERFPTAAIEREI